GQALTIASLSPLVTEWATVGGGGGGGAVDSVNGQTGVVVLDHEDVGADEEGSAASAQAAAVQRGNHTGTQAISTVSGLQDALNAIPETADDVGAVAVVRWNGSAWGARPAGAAFGVRFISTN